MLLGGWRGREYRAQRRVYRYLDMPKPEVQRTQRIGWLRAAVLGADDGIVSIASLLVGVAASGADRAANRRLTMLG